MFGLRSAFAVVLLALANAATAPGAALEEAVAKSKKSGLPLLVIGVTETCPYCVELEKRLTTEADLMPLVNQYVSIKLLVDQAEFAAFSRAYAPSGNGVPMIFVVSSDGKEIANVAGLPQGEGLKQLLLDGIEKTGGFKKPLGEDSKSSGGRSSGSVIAVRTEKTLRAAKKLLARNQKAAAVELLATSLRARTKASHANAKANSEKSPDSEASEFETLVAELTQEGLAELDKATARAESKDEWLVAAVMHERVRRIYGGLPDVATRLDAFADLYRADALKAPLLEHAAAIDKAREFDERKIKTRAVAAYQIVIDAFPDSEAARLSAKRIEQLSKGN